MYSGGDCVDERVPFVNLLAIPLGGDHLDDRCQAIEQTTE
jgi:hypothetical protein